MTLRLFFKLILHRRPSHLFFFPPTGEAQENSIEVELLQKSNICRPCVSVSSKNGPYFSLDSFFIDLGLFGVFFF